MKKESTNPFEILSQLHFGKPDFESQAVEDNKQIAEYKNKYHDFKIRIWLEKKHRGGKAVSLIIGIDLPLEELKLIAKKIKSKLGVGGSVSEGTILIQSQKRDEIIELLHTEGFRDIKKAGG